jgi:hypothetical protein
MIDFVRPCAKKRLLGRPPIGDFGSERVKVVNSAILDLRAQWFERSEASAREITKGKIRALRQKIKQTFG